MLLLFATFLALQASPRSSYADAPWVSVTSRGAHCDGKTDDTTAIRRSIAEVTKDGGVVVIPDGRTCVVATNSSPALNMDRAANVSMVGGITGMRSRPGGATNLIGRLLFTGSPAVAISARGSYGVSVERLALEATNPDFKGTLLETSHSPGDVRCGGRACDTQAFYAQSVTFSGNRNASILLDLDKAILSAVNNCHFFGGITQLRGASRAGSYSNVIKVRDSDFNGSRSVKNFILNPSESWLIEGNAFEVNDSAAATIGNSGDFADAVGVTFIGNWDGDQTGTEAFTKYEIPAKAQGWLISGNVIRATHDNVTAFRVGDHAEGIVIQGNSYGGGSTFGSLYFLGGGVSVHIGINSYTGAKITSFIMGKPAHGVVYSSAGTPVQY